MISFLFNQKEGGGEGIEREGDDSLRRRLSNTPNYVDIIVIIGLSLLMFYLLKVLLKISLKWKMNTRTRIQEILEQRRNARDEFRTENGYSWDYCLVFKVLGPKDEATNKQKKWNLKYIVRELTKGGLETKLFYSAQADEVYLKLRVSYDRLQREADRINLKLPLNPIELKHLLLTGRYDGNKLLWGPVHIPEKSPETTISPYDYIYARYEYQRDDVAMLYKKWDNRTVFRSVDRLKLILSIIKSPHNEGGCNLDIYKIIQDGGILGCFPIHDKLELLSLQDKWLVFWQWPWNQPIDDVKNYFGEKVALYFLWLAHYTSWMLFAGIIGFFCWINIADKGNDPNAVIVPYFSCFMALWATLFLEFWKRKEAYHGMKWGMTGYEEEEQTRPQFEGVPIKSPINGHEYLYFPATEKTKRLISSAITISGFIVLVIAIVGSIFVLKLVLAGIPSTSSSAAIIASLANAVQIQVMNIIYGGVAVKLTDYENHRTDTEYEDSLIGKTFVFQFVNSFAALFYITFFKPYLIEDPCLGTCLGELQTNLGTIFLTRLALGNSLKVIIPNILSYLAEKSNQSGKLIHSFTELEREFFLAEYHVMLGPFTDYADASIQYGFATMFIVAYPLATVLSFVNNYIQLRVDAWRLIQQCRRPEPRSAEDIGTWQYILETVSIFALLINSALIAFTGSFAQNHTWAERIWIFVCTAAGLYTVKLFIAYVIPDVPPEVEIQLKRQEYILGKVLDNIQDENDDDLIDVETIRIPDFSVKFTDEDEL